jgi:hypothetical protein
LRRFFVQDFAWQGFQLAVPDDWECVKYSKNRARGECALADHAGPRLSLAWSAVKAQADLDGLLAALLKQVRTADPEGPPPWRGFLWRGTDRLAVAVAHFPEARLLAKVQFFRPAAPQPRLEDEILASVIHQPPDAPWRWRAFGCRVMLPSEFALEQCEALVGKVALGFRAPGRKGGSFLVRRLALPELCLKGRSLEEWYRAEAPKGVRVLSAAPASVRGHAATELEVSVPPQTSWRKLIRRWSRRRCLLWVCERERRLYGAEWDSPPPASLNLGGAGAGGPGAALERLVECA